MPAKPPYTINAKIESLIADISSRLSHIVPDASPQKRKEQNIRAVHASLAIEECSLTLEQVTDVVYGRRVVAVPADILAVKQGFSTYTQMESFAPFSIQDFLRAHQLMMRGLVDSAGTFRTKGVGVYDGDRLIHMAPQAALVSGHMENLFGWAQSAQIHPLVKSVVLHYEIEFIHPFMDGNGRMGRLWQAVTLAGWDALFLRLPVETIILARQAEYYTALSQSDQVGNSAAFIEFMLTAIADLLALEEKHQVQ